MSQDRGGGAQGRCSGAHCETGRERASRKGHLSWAGDGSRQPSVLIYEVGMGRAPDSQALMNTGTLPEQDLPLGRNNFTRLALAVTQVQPPEALACREHVMVLGFPALTSIESLRVCLERALPSHVPAVRGGLTHPRLCGSRRDPDLSWAWLTAQHMTKSGQLMPTKTSAACLLGRRSTSSNLNRRRRQSF